MNTRAGREPRRRGRPASVTICPKCGLAGWHRVTCENAATRQNPSSQPTEGQP